MTQSGEWEPRIIAFCCNYCAYAAADLAGSKRMQYPVNVRIIHTPSTGKLEMAHILGAFEKGIDGILVAGCLEGGCHFLEGNLRARKRTDRIRQMLDEIGEREVGIASYAMRMARKIEGQPLELTQITIERQCENEFIKDLAEPASKVEAIVSFGCGAGVQAIAERFPSKPVYAGLNTQFLGILEEQAVWTEKCMGCGDCMLAQFGGICPVTRCAKRMLNGPCGGSKETPCEVAEDRPCAWQLIYTRLKNIDQLDRLDTIVPPKDWRPAWHAGACKIVRAEHRV